jgi:SAM-dependent methyltransferase
MLPLTRGGGAKRIRKKGHRDYVGGGWEELGRIQFDFMVAQGLEPHHVLVDVACGSLRAGVHFIPYLDVGNYLGIDKEALLIERGIELELGADVAAEKKPELVVSDAFEFDRFSKKPDFGIANSLFTHLRPDHIELCLRNLRAVGGCRFFTSFKEVERPVRNPWRSADYRGFSYTRRQMEEMGERTGWSPHYIGDWGHRRRAMMIEYRPA